MAKFYFLCCTIKNTNYYFLNLGLPNPSGNGQPNPLGAQNNPLQGLEIILYKHFLFK